MTQRTALLFIALVLGLGWAIRGHFGHEHGAAWAGALAGMAVIVAAKREDWIRRLPTLAALAAVGWGVGGMMSYGRIVGYGRGTDFGNVLYGLAMLGVVGALYGYIGGGLFGLGLETPPDRKPKWSQLFTEMIAGGLIFWYVLIAQFEWFMTPPRSELWAACLGAAVALAWYLYRNGYFRALRVAGYAALGAGFGFAFGNFLQVMGNVSGLTFNWWNVMEFSLGFFGGLGMAYGVFSREWPTSLESSKLANHLALIFLLVALPLVNIIQAFDVEKFLPMAERLDITNGVAFAKLQILFAYIATIIFATLGFLLFRAYSNSKTSQNRFAAAMLFLYVMFYLAFSHIIKLVFYAGLPFQLNQVLYWIVLFIFFAMWFLNRNKTNELTFLPGPQETWARWLKIVGFIVFVLIVLTLIAVNSHGDMPGSHERF